MMDSRTSNRRHVLVAGAGVVGLCAAWELLRRGFAVTVADRGGPDRDCCSKGNAGLVVPSHVLPLAAPGALAMGLRMMGRRDSPFYIQPRWSLRLLRWTWEFYRAANWEKARRAAPVLRDLHLASRAAFKELAESSGLEFDFKSKGLLMVCRTRKGLEEESKTAEFARSLGVSARVLDREETAAMNPDLEVDALGAVYFSDDCHLSPRRFLEGLQSRLESMGATFRWNAEVIGWRTADDRLEAAVTTAGDLPADEFVLAGGAWSEDMARELRLRLPIQAAKGYNVTLPRAPRLPSVPMILTEARVAVTPLGTDLRLGGTMEMAGLDSSISRRRVQGILNSIPPYLPQYSPGDFSSLSPWSGLRPCSPDGLPYLGRPRGRANLCVATGHAMIGLSLGPITGRIVGEILSGDKPSVDLALLSPDRYA